MLSMDHESLERATPLPPLIEEPRFMIVPGQGIMDAVWGDAGRADFPYVRNLTGIVWARLLDALCESFFPVCLVNDFLKHAFEPRIWSVRK